jgi:hypothetical protein
MDPTQLAPYLPSLDLGHLLPYLEYVKNAEPYTKLAESIAKTLAIVIGGFWGYRLFVARRQHYPRAELSQAISHKRLENGQVLLVVNLVTKNVGDILLTIQQGDAWVQQIDPCPGEIASKLQAGENVLDEDGHQVLWPSLEDRRLRWKRGELEIEPGESDQVELDFLLPTYVRTVRVYSYLRNTRKRRWKRDIGWRISATYDIPESQARSEPSWSELAAAVTRRLKSRQRI